MNVRRAADAPAVRYLSIIDQQFEAYGVMSVEFEWDRNKAAANLSKHRVPFDEAKTIFDDPLYVDF